ncbi:hypothetical protein C922_02255 [Plasmodium inui San Antonio 1]|uniref:Tryptophan/threonine-rich plasmodium antigen C-terminal domain-containing protein n=1 Tax=Plasmodium inui San Antonio 1 TaxID=1237626 RepID=W7AES8_9APIC|nr:hypothetical protein C922_02255 [Plasmodium inui San Antonio 1]EUD67549.1 hypothetical protein C922_02255 [Plasmodium inui San Antonio 1]
MFERLEEKWLPFCKNDDFIKEEVARYSLLFSKYLNIPEGSNPNSSLCYIYIAMSIVLHYGLTCLTNLNPIKRRELRRYHDLSYTHFEEIKKNDTSAHSSKDKDYNRTDKIVDQIVNPNFPNVEIGTNSNLTDQSVCHVRGEYFPNITKENFAKRDGHTFSNIPGDSFSELEGENLTHIRKHKFFILPKLEVAMRRRRSKFSKAVIPSKGNIDRETCPDITNESLFNIMKKKSQIVESKKSPNTITKNYPSDEFKNPLNLESKQSLNASTENLPNVAANKSFSIQAKRTPAVEQKNISDVEAKRTSAVEEKNISDVEANKLFPAVEEKKTPAVEANKLFPAVEEKKTPAVEANKLFTAVEEKKSPAVEARNTPVLEAKKVTKVTIKGDPNLGNNKSPAQTIRKPLAESDKKTTNATIEKESTPIAHQTEPAAKSHFQNFLNNAIFWLKEKILSQMNTIKKKLLGVKTQPSEARKAGDRTDDSEKPEREEHSEEWKIQQFRNWIDNLDKEYNTWKVSLGNDNQWFLEKNVVFQNILNRIKERWIFWNTDTLKDINEGKIRLKDLDIEEQWSKWLDTNWKSYNKRIWIDLTDSYEKLYYHWIRTEWNKWREKKMTEWTSQEWKIHEDEKWQQWESRKWAKYFERKEKKKWIKWIKRNEMEITTIRSWQREKGNMLLQGDDSLNWDKWKEEKFQILDEYLDSLKNHWLAEKKWLILTNASKEREQAGERAAPGGEKAAVKNAQKNRDKADDQTDEVN